MYTLYYGYIKYASINFKNSNPPVEPVCVFGLEFFKCAGSQIVTYLFQERIIEIKVVDDGKPHGKHLTRLEKMAKIRL